MSLRRLGLLLVVPTVVGLSLSACGTEDDAAPGPSGGSGVTAGAGGTGGDVANGGANGGTGAVGGLDAEGGTAGEPGPGGAGGDSAGGAAGDGPSPSAGAGNIAGEGGEGGVGSVAPVNSCRLLLANFDTDPGGAMGRYVNPSSGPVKDSVVSWTDAEGVDALGAGKLLATFRVAGEQAQLSLYFNHATWVCQTKLHAKVKLIAATDLTHINGVSLTINSGTGSYSAHFTSTTSWAMDTWYSIELPFLTASYQSPANTLPVFTDVTSIGIQALARTTGTIPVDTTMYVDDVWVE